MHNSHGMQFQNIYPTTILGQFQKPNELFQITKRTHVPFYWQKLLGVVGGVFANNKYTNISNNSK